MPVCIAYIRKIYTPTPSFKCVGVRIYLRELFRTAGPGEIDHRAQVAWVTDASK